MNKWFIPFLCFGLFVYSKELSSQDTDSIIKKQDYSKVSMRVSLGALPIAPSGDLENSSGNTGTLDLLFNLSRNFYIGAYSTHMINFKSYELVLVDNKVIDLSSSQYGIAGLSLGYRILNSKRIRISPEIKTGIAFYLGKSIGFSTDNTSFIDRKSIVMNPNLTLGYKISEKFMLGGYGGYQFLVSTIKGPEMEYFNPSTLNYGLTMQIEL